jgi:hypothetical protein
MNLTFKHDYGKDIWCLLNFGKSSNNSSIPTKVYVLLTAKYGDNPTKTNVRNFIVSYLSENNVNIQTCITDFQEDWNCISDEYHRRAQAIFGITLPLNITAYLTINNRCPYNIAENFFFISLNPERVRLTSMHELWHFYTWYGLGTHEEDRLGKQKYNDIKESFTTLLNVIYPDILLEGSQDAGYPQHQELRSEIETLWNQENDIRKVWNIITSHPQHPPL